MTVLLAATELDVGYAERGGEPRTVLAGVSARVGAGELICVLGPNGAGKSTLLRTLAGMQEPLAGRVEVLGSPLASLRPRQLARRIGVVLPERVQSGMLTAAALVALGRHPYTDWLGRMQPEDEAKVRRAIQAVGAEHLAARDVGNLSDGERQKVMIARALAQEPTVLILDEPTAFLDLPGRVEVMSLLLALAREPAGGAGRAVLLSTHDLDLALRSADRVWLLDGRGRMADGAPEDLVLRGDFQAAFERQEVRYDPESGSFRIAAEPSGRVRLRGDGLAGRWTRRALERCGFAVDEGTGAEDEDIPSVAIDGEGTERAWRLSRRGGSSVHRSIEELLRALRSDADTDASTDANNL
jgi:iron complex transport system ATP-binding protein